MSESSPLDLFFAEKMVAKMAAPTEGQRRFLQRLMQAAREGHLCWTPLPGSAEEEGARSLPPTLLKEGEELFPATPIVSHQGRYYLQKNWVYESYFLEQWGRLKKRPPLTLCDPTIFFDELEQKGALTPEQKGALRALFESPLALLSGGPGTGKTYTASHFTHLLVQSAREKKFRIALAAPTGKAAAHLQKALLAQAPLPPWVEIEAMTLHRLLRLRPGECRLFQGRQIQADLILVDEASMIDLPLFTHLLEAVPDQGRLLLMGDPDQLPPVDAMSPFFELAPCEAISLRKTMRTSDETLGALREAIRGGSWETAEPWFKKVERRWEEELWNLGGAWISPQEISPREAFERFDRFRIIGALRQGGEGIDRINQKMVERLARQIRPGQWWALPLLVTTNEPELELYNGTAGVLIGRAEGFFSLRKGVGYFPSLEGKGYRALSHLPPYEIALAISIHKSQGSEFDEVVALFPEGSEKLGREALYTAATRAKKKLEMIFDEKTMRALFLERAARSSGILERLKLSERGE